MVAPITQMFGKKTIKLLPQETKGKYMFDGQFVATRAALEKFGEGVVIACHLIIKKQVNKKRGLVLFQAHYNAIRML